ncbi:rhomboid family intramembrane serine protease [Bacteroidia bacterium]|jgi:membrane associated rhomboid family serine protease|nr:rhomboid family intramembrane serine protease [Bacteroidia bacterium]
MTIWEKIKYEYNKGGSAIRQIIMINLGVFVFTIFVGIVAKLSGFQPNELLEYFYIPSNLGVLLIRPWSIITNIFFHSGFWHILGNMLLLYFIGRVLEDFMDSNKVWKIFLYGGLAGAALFVISYNVFPIFEEVKSYKKLLGASGGVTAILVATGLYVPRYQIRPFGLFNVEMRWVALFLVFRDLYLFPVSDNTGGLFAHIGGAIFGMLYILHLQGKIELPTINGKSIVPSKMKKVPVDESTIATERTYKKHQPNQDQIDAILDKISQSGYDSLNTTEKEILFKASE